MNEINIKLKTITVNSEIRELPIRKRFITRLPRKLKKVLKKFHGDNYETWLNTPMKWITDFNLSDCYYNYDCEEELTKLLIEEINEESNRNTSTEQKL